jgi:tetratricopeptide (TPR) repeat protein
VEHISELAGFSESETDHALRSLINRSLVVPSDELKNFVLVPLVADFLRKKNPEVVANTGDCLEKRAYALIVENGFRRHDRFPLLDAAWPTIAAALPGLLARPNDMLATAYQAISSFLHFTGRWDEWLALSRDAEARAVAVGDSRLAGWAAHETGWIHYLRGQSAEVLACADRVETHWRENPSRVAHQVSASRLRGLGHEVAKDYDAAILAFGKFVEFWRTLDPETGNFAIAISDLARAEMKSGNFNLAERHFNEALTIAERINDREKITIYTGNLGDIALYRSDWAPAETLSRRALSLAEEIGRLELVALGCSRLAKTLVRQGKKAEALPHARRGVEICSRLGSWRLADARETLNECES